ncbi:hypothetical protein [Streptomyces sp. NBC_01176]|uniref:hypothetical protein n=1 Tax=Streptomyces sp. NBC_01176 TaxID=2903760 RepID=UPI00386D396E|nr:hypothetical protein OG199_22950 [Streptomyces sp. NBC_01176]
MNEQPANPSDAGAVPAADTPEPTATPGSTVTPEPTATAEPAATPEPVAPETSAEPGSTVPEPAPARKRVRRGSVAAVAGAVLLVGAVVAGSAYTVVTVQDADRDPGAPTWTFPKTAHDARTAKGPTGLAAVLVPYGTDGWTRGPDIAEFGNDASLSGPEATALRKESLRELPRSQRRQLEKRIDKEHTKGIAMRSYLGTDTYTLQAEFTVSIELAQMEDKTAVRNMSTFQNEFFDALKIFRTGPKIEGHKNAKCFLPPKDKKEKLDAMVCSAYQGDVLVSLTAYGAKPLNTKGVAKLLREQLDRIAEPGEAV